MRSPPVILSPPSSRDLRRDRSILALAAALCGALGAAGLAALAVSAQLSTDHHDRAIADATLALSSATELLERTRGELEAERKALRSGPDGPKLASDEALRKAQPRALDKHPKHANQCKHRKHRKHRGHQPGDEGAGPPQVASTLAAMTSGERLSERVSHDFFKTLRPAGIRCDSEHHCQIDTAVADAAEPLPSDSKLRARYVEVLRDGERVGTKIYGARSGSPMKLLGFRNGDTIRSIRLTRPAQLDTTSDKPLPATLSVKFERKGETMRKLIDVS